MLRGLLRNTIVLCLGLIGLVCVSWLFSAPSKEQRGVWATEGYGLFLDIGRTVIDVYQVTDVSCHRGMRIPAHLWAVEMLEGATFHIQDARLKLDVSGTLQPIFADRVDSLPDQCGADFASTDPSIYMTVKTTFLRRNRRTGMKTGMPCVMPLGRV